MRKLSILSLFIFSVAVFFSDLSWAKGRRDELKEQFAPSKNIRQMQNIPLQYEDEYYYQQKKEDSRSLKKSVRRNIQSREMRSKPFLGEYAIYQSEYETIIEEEIALIKGRISFEVFKKNGWVKIPLAESSVGLKEVSLNRKSSFVIREGNKYQLLIGKPGLYNLDLEFFVKVKREREYGPGSVSFDVLPSPISILDVGMQETEVEIFVEPSIKIETERLAKKTLATVVLPYTEKVMVRWSKSLPREIISKVQLEPKLYADTVTLVSIGDGIAKCSSQLNYSILQSEVSNLRFSLPEDVGILDVSGNQLRDWKVKTEDGRQIIDAYLTYGVKGSYVLNVTYEKNIGAGSVTSQLPGINVLSTERQRGFVGIEARTNIELVFNKLTGASVIDVKELPQQIWSQAKNPVILAFKYLKFPYGVVIDVTKHEEIPVLLAAIDSASYVTLLTEEGKTLTKATYQMRNNVKQFVRISLPKGASLWSCFVSGKPVKPAKDKQGRILISLEKSRVTGEALTQFPVEVVYLTKEPKLGAFGKLKLELPKLDIPANELLWSVYLPKKFTYFKFDGDVEMVKDSSFGFAPRIVQSTLEMEEGLREKKEFDRVRKFKSQSQTQYAPMSQVFTRQHKVAEQQVFGGLADIQGRGTLPIKINVPKKGKLYRFSKLLITNENPWISTSYVDFFGGGFKVIGLTLFIIFISLVAFLAKKKRLIKTSEK